MASELEELTKIVAESKLFDMDFSNQLATSETISAVTSVVSTNQANVDSSSDITVGTSAISGSLVQFRISGGTKYETYRITVTITTNNGNTLIGEGLLGVE